MLPIKVRYCPVWGGCDITFHCRRLLLGLELSFESFCWSPHFYEMETYKLWGAKIGFVKEGMGLRWLCFSVEWLPKQLDYTGEEACNAW